MLSVKKLVYHLFISATLVSCLHAQTSNQGNYQPITPKRIFDFDGNGSPDQVAVDIAYSSGLTVNGKVQIRSVGGEIIQTLISPNATDFFGAAIAKPGNIDGIPGDEIAISAPLGHQSGNRSGAVYIFSHGSDYPIYTILGDSDGAFGTGLGYRQSTLNDGTSPGELVILSDPVSDLSSYNSTVDNYYTWNSYRLDNLNAVGQGDILDFSDSTDWGDIWTFREGFESDINLDGLITVDDISAINLLVGNSSNETGVIIRGDLNRDGTVDSLDVAIVSQSVTESISLIDTAGATPGLPCGRIIKGAIGFGKTVGFFALVHASQLLTALSSSVQSQHQIPRMQRNVFV